MVMVLWLDEGIGKSTSAKTLLMDPTKASGIHTPEVPSQGFLIFTCRKNA
jgi:hypothetical protein